ncbi:hypothetical protein JCM19232_5579 [Vibrio ishigakensis]|uniref:Uncharacterized protein n=1 Tax=Vibrio ishigakensis TaxID=1481914 RepID=A0A0B8PDR7_9VIBR|nr:hypothetical protein JCM19232_5579 [Vibrio ishigakensis]
MSPCFNQVIAPFTARQNPDNSGLWCQNIGLRVTSLNKASIPYFHILD